MCFEITKMIVLYFISVLLGLCLCVKLKLFQTDHRVTAVSETYDNLSLLECSVLFQNDKKRFSFNYNKETQICEMSNNFPEGLTIISTGWNVYSLESNYYFGSAYVTQSEAVAICDGMSARLVIIDSQEELEFLETQVLGFDHWIGMTCTSGTNCKWVDGRSADSGFTQWAPNEPSGMDCVWIGYQGNNFDDLYCDVPHKVLCEYL
ncbi:asialoglycoprotein receptor 1-like [Ruditapes philippinarum]|uniref:asialoglycoprotein receptor 1-like n=1 Tax=Ruditapes philippinarum TaxID=129788 RepID=UPI00295AF028|nr:asialoglycoprotein receptor 1-like [Ruditapes philippinarum]